MAPIPALSHNIISQVSKTIAYHEGGSISHKQITEELRRIGVQDLTEVNDNKQKRLERSLLLHQEKVGCANNILDFIQSLADPVRFVGKREEFDSFRAELNSALIFASYEIRSDGKIITVKRATTLDEAEERASRLRKKLDDRKVHNDVMNCCRKELIRDNNYFHTVLEASKSLSQKIREKTKSKSDGHELVNETLFAAKNVKYPILTINKYETSSDQSEQKGFGLLVKGMYSMFRNPLAHDPKTVRQVTEDEALEFLVLVSLLHRKIDQAFVTDGFTLVRVED